MVNIIRNEDTNFTDDADMEHKLTQRCRTYI